MRRVFIGLENINPQNLLGAKKRQNKITEYREMLMAWKAARVITYAGYILGFPNDTPESILADIDVIKRELPVDLLEFFYLTPLPGSEDHLKLVRAGAPLDPDMNKYDLNHVCTTHPRMSAEEWNRVYRQAWQRYYTTDHIDDDFPARGRLEGQRRQRAVPDHLVQGQHRYREDPPARDRLPAPEIPPRPQVRPAIASRSGNSIRDTSARPPSSWRRWTTLYLRLRRIYLRIKRDPQRFAYTDLATRVMDDQETSALELFGTEAAQAYASEQRRLKDVRNAAAARSPRGRLPPTSMFRSALFARIVMWVPALGRYP